VLDLQTHNSVAVVILSRDESHPRLCRAVLEELADLLVTVRKERVFQGIIIAAGSKSFATGADIEELAPLKGEAAREFSQLGQRVMGEIAAFPQPVVAAIRGYCLGGGLDLALACHARVATYDSSLGHPGGSLGLLTGWGGTQRLPRLIGKAQALQVLLAGDYIPATQALTLGLVDALVPDADLISTAVQRIQEMNSAPLSSARGDGSQRIATQLRLDE